MVLTQLNTESVLRYTQHVFSRSSTENVTELRQPLHSLVYFDGPERHFRRKLAFVRIPQDLYSTKYRSCVAMGRWPHSWCGMKDARGSSLLVMYRREQRHMDAM